MLNTYLTATQNLLQNPTSPTPLYDPATLTTYINTARGQLAGESQCIRFMGTVPLEANQQVYPFSSVVFAGDPPVLGPINVRTIWLRFDSGLVWVAPEAFEEFSLYELNVQTPATGSPTRWAQYGQGVFGSIYLAPVPLAVGTAQADCVCYPIPLVDDTTAEAIPYLWTDAVPYFAAYLALLSAQTGARTADADKMLQRYSQFVERARRASTSAVVPWLYEQTAVPGGLNTPPQQSGGQQ